MHAGLLAVADDVEAAILLALHRQDRGVALALGEGVAVKPPRRPQALGLGEPARLRQAAGKCGEKHGANVPPHTSDSRSG